MNNTASVRIESVLYKVNKKKCSLQLRVELRVELREVTMDTNSIHTRVVLISIIREKFKPSKVICHFLHALLQS